jgi:hypothetical protein
MRLRDIAFLCAVIAAFVFVLAVAPAGDVCREAEAVMLECGFGFGGDDDALLLRQACDANEPIMRLMARCIVKAGDYEQTRGCSPKRYLACLTIVSEEIQAGRLDAKDGGRR